jgi:hypothetical protein
VNHCAQLVALLDEVGGIHPDIGRLIVGYTKSNLTVTFFYSYLGIPYRGGGHNTDYEIANVGDCIHYRHSSYKGRSNNTTMNVFSDELGLLLESLRSELPGTSAQDLARYLAWMSEVE